MKFLVFSFTILLAVTFCNSYLYPTFLDVYNNVPFYSNYIHYQYLPAPETNLYPDVTKNTISQLPPLNILAEIPNKISTEFSVVPLVIVSAENLRVLNKIQILDISQINPTMRVKVDNSIVECTPTANITLNKPLTVYSLRTNIIFPSVVEISDANSVIPLKIGAVMAPVSGNLFVSPDTPIYVQTVFAIPTEPFKILSNKPKDQDSVSVESTPNLEPHNITVLHFPEEVAAPVFEVDEEDDELVNRNPPNVLAPGGIVQSTQPMISVEPFTNSKESEILSEIKGEANKKKV